MNTPKTSAQYAALSENLRIRRNLEAIQRGTNPRAGTLHDACVAVLGEHSPPIRTEGDLAMEIARLKRREDELWKLCRPDLYANASKILTF